jgi:hypothetical protein
MRLKLQHEQKAADSCKIYNFIVPTCFSFDSFQAKRKRTEWLLLLMLFLVSHHRDGTKKGAGEESYYVLSDEEKKEPNLSLIIRMNIFSGRSLRSAHLGKGFAIA